MTNIKKTYSIRFLRITGLLILLLIGIFTTRSVQAQSSTQVTIIGIPPVLSSPFADEIEANFKSGQYQVILNYSGFSTQPVDLVFDFVVTRNGRELINITSAPMAFAPGSYIFSSFFEEIQFRETADEILNRLDRELRNQLVQSGTIPEGNYTIEISARPFTQQSGILPVPGRAIFSVRYPTPPILVSIPDGANVTFETPTFSWTPVVSSIGGTFEYDFLLVEIFPEQTPLQAINSNRAQLQQTLNSQTMLPYTFEYLPLEEGVSYAWRVIARDAFGRIPLQNGGESDIYTFTFREKTDEPMITDLRELERIPLIPGFAELTELNRLEISETETYFELNGAALLNLEFDFTDPVQTRAAVRGLRIQKSSLNNPIVMGGELAASIRSAEELFSTISDYVRFRDLNWRFGDGFSLQAELVSTEGQTFGSTGSLRIDRSGLSGVLYAEATAGESLFSIGSEPVELLIDRMTASFPAQYITARGTLSTPGSDACVVPAISLNNDTFQTFADCDLDLNFMLVPGSDLATLQISNLSGNISGSWENSEQLNYDLSMNSLLSFRLDKDILTVDRCGFSGFLNLSSENGWSSGNFLPDCTLPEPYLDLGIFKLIYSDPQIARLGFSEESGWDFEFVLNANLMLPAVQKVPLPEMENIRISRDGISFPAIEFGEADLQPFTVFELGETELSMNRFAIENQVFPWFEWDGTGSGPLKVNFDAAITFPDVCKSPLIGYLNASMQVDGITGDIEFPESGSCQWEFGEGYVVKTTQLDGELSLDYRDRIITPEADLNVNGELVLGEPFTCGTESNTIPLENLDIRLTDNGFEASLSNLIPVCPVAVGPYEAVVTGSDLTLGYSKAGITIAELNARADLNLGEDQQANGAFTVDLISGEFTDMDFELEGPFTWGIPKNDPILLFTINRAVVNENGLFIDGRQSLELSGESIGTTFDNTQIDWSSFEVTGGRIILDEGFSLMAGINPSSGELDYAATRDTTSLAMEPGVLLTLAGTVIIDENGLHSTGTSTGILRYGDFSLDDLEVTFTEDFAMALDPFSVWRGAAEIYWNDQRVAVVDPSGFRPDPAFFGDQFLPDRIPLPTEDIAYLELRRNGELIVDAENMGDGTYRISTRANEPLSLVMPAFQGSAPQAPQVDVTLTDFRVNPSNGSYISGEARADLGSSGLSAFMEAASIPLAPEEVIFTTHSDEQTTLTALFVRGRLNILDHEFEDTGEITLFMQSDGRLKGNFSFQNVSESISMDPGSSRVTFDVNSLAGYLDIPVTMPGTPDLEIAFSGNFHVNGFNGEPIAEAALEALFTEQGFSVTQFEAGTGLEDASLDLEFFRFTIEQIKTLALTYSEQDGFEYFADLDLEVELLIPDSDPISIPLKNIDLRSGVGIVIPQQDIHDGSNPVLDVPGFDLGVFRLKPLAFRMSRDTLNIHDLSSGSLIDLLPELDLEITFPEYAQTAPGLSGISLTLNGVAFNSGILTGSVLPYVTDMNPVKVPIGPLDLSVTLFEGDLFETDIGAQGISIDLEGSLAMPDYFDPPASECGDPTLQLSLSSDGAFTGSAQQFLPCGSYVLGPLSLAFGESLLEFYADQDGQKAIIDGTATAEIERDEMSPITASGQLEFDLIGGTVLSGNISITDPFTWYLPSDGPLFAFTVQNALIDQNGLMFSGDGSLEVGDGNVDVQFSDLLIDLGDGSVTGGSVNIQNQFAFDVEFGPTRWSVSDPAEPVAFSSGIRLEMPSGITIDQNGFDVNGQANASLRFAGEVYDGLELRLLDLTFAFEPFRVTSGRADLILNENGEPVRLAYYDSGGFHLDNLAGALAMPDTLGLPSKDIAYIVLRDEQGQNLVQSANVEGGLELSTTQPVPLVLAGLSDSQGTSPQVNVSFSGLVINASLDVSAGSISADVSGTPLNLAAYGDFPIGLTAVHYQKSDGGTYTLSADATLNLPSALTEAEVLVENLVLGPNGFGDLMVSAGNFTEQHTEGTSAAVAEQSFSGGDFIFSVRGVELNFGIAPQYRFSGDISSDFLSGNNGEEAYIHFSADYAAGNWNFTLDTDHLFPQEIPIGLARLVLDDIQAETDQNDFNLVIDGRLALPDVAGSDFEIGIERLIVGTSGISVDQINTTAITPQQLGLFGEPDNLRLNTLSLDLTSDKHLMLTAGGELSFLDRQFSFSDLRIGTDGTFQLGNGNVNLVGSSNPVELMEEYLVLTQLSIGVNNNRAELTAGGMASMPSPLDSEAGFSITVDHAGSVEVTGPSFVFTNANVSLGDLAEFSLTGAGLEVNNIHQGDLTLYASAEVNMEGGTIQFGTPGSPGTWGIRYRMQQNRLEWNLTGSPDFTFNAGMFDMEIQNVSISDEQAEAFGLSLDTNAKLRLSGIDGSGLQIEGFTITADGIGSMGNVMGGEFSLANVINITVGQFDWGRNETITVKKQDGSDSDPGSSDLQVDVEEFVRFGNQSGDAVSITIPGGFSGSISEIFYYRNADLFYLNIEGVSVKLGDHAELFASFEYQKQADGFSLFVAGGGELASPIGDNSIGLAAMGTMSNLGGEFRFGIFVKLTASIPILPGVLTLTEVGGGFLYNPTDQDFDRVLAISGHDFGNGDEAREKPWEGSNVSFAIAIYAQAGLVNMVDGHAAEGSAMLFVTNKWLNLDLDATMLGRDEEFTAGFTLYVQWDPYVLINGSAYGELNVNPLLSASMEMNFIYADPVDSDSVWGVSANADFRILNFLNASGEFMASNTGFYVGVLVSGGFDVWVISVNASFDASVWWIYGEQFGAYVEIDVNATLFKVATVGATLKGALIVDDGFLIYAEASAYVDVLFVFSGRVSIWAAIRDGKISGGKGSKSEYTSMIEDARNSARSIKEEMDELMAQLDEISSASQVFMMSDEQLNRAGENLFYHDRSFQQSYFLWDINNNFISPVPQTHLDIRDYVVGTTPDEWESINPGPELSLMLSEMNGEIQNLQDLNELVKGRFEDAYEMALEWDSQALVIEEDLISNPVIRADFVNSGPSGNSGPAAPDFEIDEAIDAENRNSLESYKSAVESMERQFTAAIDSVTSYINRVDQALSATYTITPAAGYVDPFSGRWIMTGAPEITQNQPSANQVANQFATTLQTMDKYYANLVSHFWEIAHWADLKYTNFDVSAASRDDVISANEGIVSRIINYGVDFYLESSGRPNTNLSVIYGDHTDFNYTDEQINAIKQSTLIRQGMIFYLESYNPETREYDLAARETNVQQFEDGLNQIISNENYSQLFASFIQRGIDFYYEVPKRGFLQLSESAVESAESAASEYNRNSRDLTTAYGSFTTTLDNIFRTKSSLTLTLHGIVDLYITELEDAVETSEEMDPESTDPFSLEETADRMRSLKEEIEETLEPPRISEIRVGKKLDEFSNKIDLFWSANHPTGTITEYSYLIHSYGATQQQSQFASMFQNLLSTGNTRFVTRYLFKSVENEYNRDVNVLVRARGPSGTAISRPATFTLSLDQYQGEGSFFESQGRTETISEVDNTPPMKPTVYFDYEKGTRIRMVPIQGDPLSPLEFQGYELNQQAVYWTNQNDQIEFTVYAMDPESDISGFEYSLGSTKGGRQIRDWTPIQGINVPSPLGETNYNDYQRLRIQNLNLSGSDTYLSIRALNGAGMRSGALEVADPVVYHGGAPAVGEFNNIQPVTLNNASSTFETSVDSPPVKTTSHWPDRVDPELNISWTAGVDVIAGIKGYEYVVTDTADPETAFGQADQIYFTSAMSAILDEQTGISYRNPFFVHLRAVNNAGTASEEVATLGPIVVQDPTRPATPIINASGKPDGVGFYLKGASIDPESGLSGYQFTFSHGLFSSNNIAWTPLPQVPIASSIKLNKLNSLAAFYYLPTDKMSQGQQMMLKVRAVNNQNHTSGEGLSWSMVYDTSPPRNPSISVSRSGSIMEVVMNNIHDPESGVKKVEFRVYDTDISNFFNKEVVPWTDLVNYSTPRVSAFSLTENVNITGYDYYNLKVYVRVTNRNGAQTTVTFQPQRVIYMNPQFNYQFNF
jgi:large repetitive protein